MVIEPDAEMQNFVAFYCCQNLQELNAGDAGVHRQAFGRGGDRPAMESVPIDDGRSGWEGGLSC